MVWKSSRAGSAGARLVISGYGVWGFIVRTMFLIWVCLNGIGLDDSLDIVATGL